VKRRNRLHRGLVSDIPYQGVAETLRVSHEAGTGDAAAIDAVVRVGAGLQRDPAPHPRGSPASWGQTTFHREIQLFTEWSFAEHGAGLIASCLSVT
jgi:hypothetical protein